jgi:hypothetical protein
MALDTAVGVVGWWAVERRKAARPDQQAGLRRGALGPALDEESSDAQKNSRIGAFALLWRSAC